jgi:acyl carrier protein
MPTTKKAEIMDILTGIIREVFDDDSLMAREEMTAADVEKWDSLSHIDLIFAVEHRFSVKLTTREITSLKNVGELAELVQKKFGASVAGNSPIRV